jgi:multidrug transporter EmrE-like cation transporter
VSAAVTFLVPAVLLAATGNLLLRLGMRSLGGATLMQTLAHALRSAKVWAGGISYVTAMGCWLQVLGRADISLVYPVFSGGAAVCVMIASVLLLGERLELRRVVGAALMIAGIFLASME